MATIPALESPVVDTTGTLDAARKQALEQQALALQQRKGSQLQVLVVPTEEEVVLEFRNTWVETSGLVLSAVGITGLAAWGFAWRRRRA